VGLFAGSATGAGLGIFFNHSRSPSVNWPIPIAVKKLILKRVFFGLSVGNMPVMAGASSSLLSFSVSVFMPTPCARSSIKILTKMRLEDVVSSSFSLMTCSISQLIPSLDSKCPKNCAMMRSRFVS